jgi:hypothetical protein
LYRSGLVLCFLLALLDLATVLPMGERPPVGVVVAGLVLGLTTLAAFLPAWRGSRAGAFTVIGSRALSALLGIGAFFDDRAPGWALVGVTVGLVLTAVAVALMLPTLRTRQTELA